jgi:sporulation protein YlmC with PRC-barrel domain
MSSEAIRQRADIINTQLITRDRAKRLGVVKEILVDIDRREVVAFGLRDSIIPAPGGMFRYVLLEKIQQIGDAILVENDDAIADIDAEVYTTLIGCEVITENNEKIGKVRGYKFDCDDGKLTSILVARLGLPLVPDNVVSTYEFSIEEVVTGGPNRLIVVEGVEERLEQISVGLIERLGFGKAPWEDEYDYRPTIVRPENQLPAGKPVVPPPKPATRQPPAARDRWREDDFAEEEPEVVAIPQPIRVEAKRYEMVEEEDNWGDDPPKASYQTVEYEPIDTPARVIPTPPQDDEEEDLWASEAEISAEPIKLNLPQPPQEPAKEPLREPIEEAQYEEEDS